MHFGKGALILNSINDVWKNVLQRLRSQLSETTIDTWFDEVEVVAMQDMVFFLCCANEFKRGMVEKLFLTNIKSALHDSFSAEIEVKILTGAERERFGSTDVKKPISLIPS